MRNFMQSIYLGRQPILNANSDLAAYEVLYRGSEEASLKYSSATIINHVLNQFGTHSLLGERRGFVKISEKFLLHDIIYSIPKEFFVFSLLAEIELSERVIERIESLHEKGYLLCVENFTLTSDDKDRYDAILQQLSFVKVNIQESLCEGLASKIEDFHKENICVIACSVGDNEEYVKAKSLGCDWFQGYYFSRPKVLGTPAFESSQASILNLYNMLLEDVNIDEITQEFETQYELTVQLLRFINSGAFHFRDKISSIHHILTLVGRQPLSQWLMLMIYSKSVRKEGHSPLMLMVKNRTELMQNILKIVEPSARSNKLGEAYLVGVLSLLDSVFNVELTTILRQINISPSVKSALLEKSGLLGEIYQLLIDIENFNTEAIHNFENRHHLEMETIERIALESMRSVNSFESYYIN